MTRPSLKIASFNIQAGIGSHLPRHVITHGWRYFLPHRHSQINLEQIAEILSPFDLVALQEADAGSFRTRYIHQQQYLATHGNFPYSHSQVTREISPIARITLGILSRQPFDILREHRLPGTRHGRGALEVMLNWHGKEIAVISTHLSLRRQSRLRQIHYLAEMINRHHSVILLGDLNCEPYTPEFELLLSLTSLKVCPKGSPPTFPSWLPRRCIDHILTTQDLRLASLYTLPKLCSDHLPIAAEIET